MLNKKLILLLFFFVSNCDSMLNEYLNSKGEIHTNVAIPSEYCKDCIFEATIVTDDPYPYYHSTNLHANVNIACTSISSLKYLDIDIYENESLKTPAKLEFFLEYKTLWKDFGDKNPSSNLSEFIEICKESNPIRLTILKRFKKMNPLPQKIQIVFKASFSTKDWEYKELLELRSTKDNRSPIRIH